MISPSCTRLIPLLAAYLVACLATARAEVLLGPVQMGGFVSQGAIVSDSNQYFGTTNSGEYRFTELAVNFTYNPLPKLRLGLQVFAFQLGKYGNMVPDIDWATADYQFEPWLGIRAGRIKLPHGLHNEVLDIDAVRPWIFLPQSIYDSRNRDFFSAIDGGSFYGNVPLGPAGALDYQFFIGVFEISGEQATGDSISDRTPYVVDDYDIGNILGYHLSYSPPLNGLRVGHSFLVINDISSTGRTKTAQELLNTPNGLRNLAPLATSTGPASSASDQYSISTFFAEYLIHDWTFTLEFEQRHSVGTWDTSQGPPAFAAATRNQGLNIRRQGWYGSVAKRINRWLELGSYYSMLWNDWNDQDGSNNVGLDGGLFQQEDIALAARFDLTRNWILKAECHWVNGTALLFNNEGQNPVNDRDQDWMYFAIKSTFSF